MEIRKVKLSQIVPYDKNPRRNDDAVDSVAESIRQCGYRARIIVDENMVVLCGHTRLKALKKLGWHEAEVQMETDLTEEQKRKYRILDNKTAELAEWDENILALELDGLDFEGFDFGFAAGFSDDGLGTDFSLKSGDKEPITNMTFTFSDDEAEVVNDAISRMKHTQRFKDFEDPKNTNGNGNALFMIVSEWIENFIDEEGE